MPLVLHAHSLDQELFTGLAASTGSFPREHNRHNYLLGLRDIAQLFVYGGLAAHIAPMAHRQLRRSGVGGLKRTCVPRTAKSRPKAAFAISKKDLENGAGEGIRTLDPNLGKVVLYP